MAELVNKNERTRMNSMSLKAGANIKSSESEKNTEDYSVLRLVFNM